ncbi:MAG: hypothetical protein NT151_09875 [Acidobacteria bacterium]|nr:hypothetical protein [Acidobacteriota bacterium]
MPNFEVVWHGGMMGFVSPWSKTKGELVGLRPDWERRDDAKDDQAAPAIEARIARRLNLRLDQARLRGADTENDSGRFGITDANPLGAWLLLDDSPGFLDNPLAQDSPKHPRADTLLSAGETSDAGR